MTTPMPADPAPGSDADNAAQTATDINLELRNLASQFQSMIAKAMGNGFAIRKAIVTSVDSQAAPPTVQMNISGDTETPVDSVRFLNNTTANVGQTVLIAKQQSEIFVIGALATSSGSTVGPADTGWKRANVAAGSHGGNGNGDIYYRRVMRDGSWLMEWRGGWNVSGSTMISGLDDEFCPSSKRSMAVSRDIAGGNIVAQIDFTSDGKATLVGGTTAQLNAGSHSHGFSVGVSVSGSASVSGSTGSGGTPAHSHGFSGSGGSDGSGSGSGTTNSAGTHQHVVNSPTWIGLNGVSYYL